MPFTIVRQDITKMKVDAIVNAANTMLQMGGGVCGAIFRAAGEDKLSAACTKLAPIQTGEAVITPGFLLPAKYIIHTSGPIYRDGRNGEEEQLRSCYRSSLRRAVENGCESIAFPLISSGIYGYPRDKALQAATGIIHEFLNAHDMDIYLVVFDKASLIISEKLTGEVASYIDEHYVREQSDSRLERRLLNFELEMVREPLKEKYHIKETRAPQLDKLIDNLDEPFSGALMKLIDAKRKTDVEVYKRANLDRKLFSKIRSVKGYMPGKRTVIALAVALELTLDETEDLLRKAGYALSHSQKFDVIVEYFIISGIYDIFRINEVLFNYDQPLLGG